MPDNVTVMAERLARLLDERSATAAAYAAASRAEPGVRTQVEGLASAPGLAGTARLVGLQHEMKSLASIGEKLGRVGDPGALKDALRYTLVLGGMNFANQVLTAVGYLRDAGCRCTKLVTTEGDKGWRRGYLGVNSNWLSGDGSPFEIQFHTELTWYAKTESHDAYEAWRKDKDNAATRDANTSRYQQCFREGAAKLGVESWKLDGTGVVLDRWFARHGRGGH